MAAPFDSNDKPALLPAGESLSLTPLSGKIEAAPGITKNGGPPPKTVVFTDAFAANAPHAHSSGTDSGTTESSWTVAIDLAWHSKSGNLTQSEADRITALQHETLGSPVSIIVQVYKPNQPGVPEGDNQIHRLMIHQGQVTDLGHKPSAGEAKDLADLLSVARTEAPSKHIGLVLNEDGMAGLGFSGDGGQMSLPEFDRAITDGLQGTHGGKLDVISLNSCLMGDTSVVDKLQKVSRNVVGSSETETINFGRADGTNSYVGQDIQRTVHNLLTKPNMTPKQLADDFIAQAKQEAHDQKPDSASEASEAPPAVATLAHFQMSKVKAFEASLSSFGAVLAKAAAEPAKLAVIEKAVADSNHLGESAITGQHDLQSFVHEIQKSINTGALKDPDGSISQAARNLSKEQGRLIATHYTDSSSTYQDQGALGTFLPDQYLTNGSLEYNPLARLHAHSQMLVDATFDENDRKSILAGIDKDMLAFEAQIPATMQGHLDSLQRSRQALNLASDAQEFSDRFRNFRDSVSELQNDESISAQLRSQDKVVLTRMADASKLTSAPGWNDFVSILANKQFGNL